MTININNQSQVISKSSSISTLLEQLNVSSNGIAIAVNNKIITKEKWGQTLIQSSDNITIIKATQGG
ncbi:sulfur carrier protein ThiS [Aquimarina celericrescens]|uniref:Sulfur carrier protein ThiS n=1 Tax=Aquimarina celericrescens TaxID=1964542 RepID=A0ABW5AXC2_9FLAO|nr:sulfur carrier protein ThiS [Aquimarina celericrescens]